MNIGKVVEASPFSRVVNQSDRKDKLVIPILPAFADPNYPITVVYVFILDWLAIVMKFRPS